MQAGGKSGLTKALEELTTLLPKALECCSGTESSQNLPLVEKLRSVLLELIHGCLTCNAGEQRHASTRKAGHTTQSQQQAVMDCLRLSKLHVASCTGTMM
jgi:hypothetical protein